MKTTSSFSVLFSRSRVLLVLLAGVLVTVTSAANTRAWLLLMQNPDIAETIISTDARERDNLVRAGWKLTGDGLLVSDGGAEKGLLHRMLRTEAPVLRRLAVNPEEVATNLEEGFVIEGAMGHVWLKEPAGGVPVHRFRKGDRLIWVSGHHEQYWAEKNGWERDGPVFWLLSMSKR